MSYDQFHDQYREQPEITHHDITAVVKWFNATKGFGFVQPTDGSPDAFLHISVVERAGHRSLPEGATAPPATPSGWGKTLFGGRPDCEAGYLDATWDLFGQVYKEAGVNDDTVPASDGVDQGILKALADEGYSDKYDSNKWIGRVGL